MIVGLVIWAIAQVTRLADGSAAHGIAGPASRQDSALDVLKQRYARGEIAKNEYDDMRRDLAL
ncbi:MAG: SHOCT domain-containing protein [Chloroflexota bacterium]|nr:SHOCT domain-containing protein [Chloroflexota bacterium]